MKIISARTPFEFNQARLFEWLSSLMMLSMAVIVFIDPASLSRGGFYLISHVGITHGAFYVLTLVFGSLRVGALVANGMSVWWGPRVRMVVSLVSSIMWSQMAYSLVVWSFQQRYISIGVPIYIFLAVGELVSSRRAADDARNANR